MDSAWALLNLPSVAFVALSRVCTLSRKRTRFLETEFLNTKFGFRFSLQDLPETFPILRKFSAKDYNLELSPPRCACTN
jgi:hypothetical protein